MAPLADVFFCFIIVYSTIPFFFWFNHLALDYGGALLYPDPACRPAPKDGLDGSALAPLRSIRPFLIMSNLTASTDGLLQSRQVEASRSLTVRRWMVK